MRRTLVAIAAWIIFLYVGAACASGTWLFWQWSAAMLGGYLIAVGVLCVVLALAHAVRHAHDVDPTDDWQDPRWQ